MVRTCLTGSWDGSGCSAPGPEHSCPSDTPGCGRLHQNEGEPPVSSEVPTALVQGFKISLVPLKPNQSS